MARLNPKRRREAKVRAALSALAHANDDSRKLQQGAVKCALNRAASAYKLITPRPLNWEGKGAKTSSKGRTFKVDGFRIVHGFDAPRIEGQIGRSKLAR